MKLERSFKGYLLLFAILTPPSLLYFIYSEQIQPVFDAIREFRTGPIPWLIFGSCMALLGLLFVGIKVAHFFVLRATKRELLRRGKDPEEFERKIRERRDHRKRSTLNEPRP